MIDNFKVVSRIYSFSHILKKGSLDQWNEEFGKKLDSPIFLEFINETNFDLIFYLTKRAKSPFIGADMVGFFFLTFLNIASLGHFWLSPALWPLPFNIIDEEKKKQLLPKFVPPYEKHYLPKRTLEFETIKKAILLNTTALDLHEKFFKYYISGMTLLSNPTISYDFHEDIFANFYKIIERFVTEEVFHNPKRYGKKDILEAYKKINISQPLLNEVERLFVLRQSTVMHSTGRDKQISLEDALKCKVAADLLLHKSLFARVEKKARAGKESKKG